MNFSSKSPFVIGKSKMSEVKVPISEYETPPKPKQLIGTRHVQFTLMFLCTVTLFCIRTSLSVSIISMTEKTPPDPSIPTYPEWDNTDVILSSFFWGYVISQVGAGQLSDYFGPKWFLVTTMTIGSIFHIIIPSMAAQFGSTGVMVCRMIQGINQGFLYPCVNYLMSRWTPLFERSRISNFVYGGANIGIAMSMPITGAIGASKFGWPAAFYLFGGLGVAWAMVFAIFAENSPSDHKGISEDEKIYIEQSSMATFNTSKRMPTPWLSILLSPCVWAIFLTNAGQCWGGFTLLTEIPTYMSSMMNFDINNNSQLSALPYVATFFVGLLGSPVSDRLISKNVFSLGTTRKIMNSVGSFVPAVALIYLAFIDNSQKNLAICLLVIAVSSAAFFQSGGLINVIDIAPDHAGTLFGIVNSSGNIFSILGPLTVGLLGSNKKDPILWRKVFLLAAVIYVVTGLIYNLFGTGEIQSWNNLERADDVESAEKNKKSEAVKIATVYI